MSALAENPNCAETHATFRLAGDDLDPDAVSAALGLEPTRAMRKDHGQRTGVWLLATEHTVGSTSLERHVIHLLDAVEPAAAALDALRRDQGLRADVFCHWVSATGHGGPVLSPETLARIAALGAPLGIDFYRPA